MCKDEIIVMAIKHAIEDKLSDIQAIDAGLLGAALEHAKILMTHANFYGVETYGRTKEEFEALCKEKRNVLFLTDQELLEYKKAKAIMSMLKEVI